MNHVWIVEVLEGKRWIPTVGASLSRDDAVEELAGWRENNPADKFRVRKYEARREP